MSFSLQKVWENKVIFKYSKVSDLVEKAEREVSEFLGEPFVSIVIFII